jgi:hypothetical protein
MLRKKNSFRPVIEVLERREVPAGGGPYIWTGVAGGVWNDPTQWTYGANSTPPGPTDDVFFDGGYSNQNCDYLLSLYGAGVNMANSISMVNNYQGRLNLRQTDFEANVGSGGLIENCGGIEQFSGLALNVNGNLNWSGGDINSETGVGADFNIQGGSGTTALIQGTTTTGSNIQIRNGVVGTLNSTDSINFTSPFSLGIYVDSQSQLTWIQGSLRNAPGVDATINNLGTLSVAGNGRNLRTALPIDNSGYFAVQNARVIITGAELGDGFYQGQGGTTDLFAGAAVQCTGGNYHQGDGNFYTRGDARIDVGSTNDVIFSGGIINLQHADQTQVATLQSDGRVRLEGGVTWNCKVNRVNNVNVADQIRATNITLGGVSSFVTVWIPGAGNPPPANQTWTVMHATNNIVGDFNTKTIMGFIRTRRVGTDYFLDS